MKINTLQFTVVLLLLTILSSVALDTQAANAPGSGEQVNNKTIYPHKTPSPDLQDKPAITKIKKNDKKILIEESRKMSPFFKLGIAINIIMLIAFSWWFSTQWRAKK